MFIPNEAGAIVISYYIDLGTSSYVAQIAIAIVLGGLATAGFYWRQILNWFKRLKSDKRNKKS